MSFVLALGVLAAGAAAQPVFRILGQVTDDKGDPIAGADVGVEALYGYAAGTFAGQRTFSAKTDAKGRWNVIGVKSGVWIFEVDAPGYVPEIVGLPITLLTTVSSRESGNSLPWTLVLKMERLPQAERAQALAAALDASRAGRKEEVRAMLTRVPADSGGDYLSCAARIAIVAREFDLAQSLFASALQEDPSAYRTALGLATGFLVKRDFDSASKAFDAARARTRDKDEVRFITIALTDLATIKVR
ncbi:MAG TPA: carboxypeptidase regulatory-like domain-containing protein [Vicinamibacterales bacterium]|nr:carboxypeptidase regulatory-like domain-containing protein [Vicinamibacterales bacterium]